MKDLDLSAIVIALSSFITFTTVSYWILMVGHPTEDAYILFTYAERLANGDGIVYFAGGEHAEGATDFLWMVVLASLVFLGLDVGVAASLLNGVGFGVIGYLIVRSLYWNSDLITKTVVGSLFVFLLIFSDIALASAVGFGTAFYVSISMLLFYLYLNDRDLTLGNRDGALLYIPWFSLLLGLIRPDGVIIGVTFSLLGLERLWRTVHKKRYIQYLMVTFILGVGYFVWRLSYFGHLLPLPLYVKSYGDGLLPGLLGNKYYLETKAIFLIICILALPLINNPKRYVLAFVPFVALLISLSFALQAQNVAFRFQGPLTGIFILSLAIFLGEYLKKTPRWQKIFVSILVVPIVASVTGQDLWMRSYISRNDYADYLPFMARDILSKKTTIALTEAGRMAYWNDAQTFDLVGLNTSHTALNKVDLQYLSNLDPDLIFIHTASTLEPITEINGPYFEATIDFVEGKIKNKIEWRGLENPIIRPCYVVYEFLKNNPEAYRVVFARHGQDFYHLYAVKIKGNVKFDDFLKKLDKSFNPEARWSYLDMKKILADSVVKENVDRTGQSH